jgi:hypothetical protein
VCLVAWTNRGNVHSDRTDLQFTPGTLQNAKDRARKIPDFVVEGHLDSAVCCITEPFSGEVSACR